MSYHVAIIGPESMTSGFRALGVESFDAERPDGVLASLRTIKDQTETGEKKYAVVFVIEDLLEDMNMEEYAKLTKAALPAVTTLPGVHGSSGKAEEKLKELTKRAIGSDIF